MQLSLSRRGRAGPSIVWERYAEIALWKSWAPHIQRVEASAERIAPGVTGTVYGPLGVRAHFVIDQVNEGRSWSWTVRSGPIEIAFDHGVEPARGGTRTTLRMHGSAPIVASYAPVAHWALRRLVRP